MGRSSADRASNKRLGGPWSSAHEELMQGDVLEGRRLVIGRG